MPPLRIGGIKVYGGVKTDGNSIPLKTWQKPVA